MFFSTAILSAVNHKRHQAYRHVPTLPRWVMGFAQIKIVFFGGGWRTDLATNLRRKAFDSCKLFVYVWLTSHQGRLQRGKWTQLASSLAQGGKNSTLKGEEFPQIYGSY